MQDNTEVVFLEMEDFLKLWSMQKKFTEQQIILQKLEQNKYFRQLNLLTKYHLVFESLELKVYFPGQLIMSVHQRSPLCVEYQELFKDGTSKFRREIDNKVMKQQVQTSTENSKGELPSQYAAFLDLLNKGKKTTQLKEMRKKLTIKSGKGDEQTEDSDDSSLGEEDEGLSRVETKEKREFAGIDIEMVDEADSDDTDFGLDHAKKILNEKDETQANGLSYGKFAG